MPQYLAEHKGFFFCIFSILLAFLASFFSKVDLNQIITTVTMAYMGGQTMQRGAAYFAASGDPKSSTMDVVQSTISFKQQQESIAQYGYIFGGIEDYVEGSEKAYDEGNEI